MHLLGAESTRRGCGAGRLTIADSLTGLFGHGHDDVVAAVVRGDRTREASNRVSDHGELASWDVKGKKQAAERMRRPEREPPAWHGLAGVGWSWLDGPDGGGLGTLVVC